MSKLVLTFLLMIGSQPATTWAGPRAADYQVGPGDLVSIRISAVQELQHSARISNSGRIRVPYVGVLLVAGMTTVEMEREIGRLMRERQLVRDPIVRVQVQEYRARPTYVIGEVNAPGQFVITGEMYLLDLLSKAGGLLPSSAESGFLYRRNMPLPRIDTRVLGTPVSADLGAAFNTAEARPIEQVFLINFSELREGTKPEANFRLQGGDILYVPRRRGENIFIIGEVKVPGAYTLPRRGQISAAQALIYAGGPLPTAKAKSGFIMRHGDGPTQKGIEFDYTAILDGRKPDILVRANDIIFIPNSATKTITRGILLMAPRILQQFLIF